MMEKTRGTAGLVEYARIATQSLRANLLRSSLTLLGIIIGITSIIVVICILNGLDRYWKEKVSNFGPNAFVITQFPITTNLDKLYELLKRNPEVHAEDAEFIQKNCPACETVGVETHRASRIRYANQAIEDVDMSGITPSIIDIEIYDVDTGRNIAQWEDDHAQFVTFIGWDLAEKFFPSTDPLGKQIQIENHWFTVVGVAAKRGSVFGMSRDNFAKIPLAAFQKIYGARRSVNISIKARTGQMAAAEDQARVAMRTKHRLAFREEDDFGMITSEGVNELFDNLTRIIFSVILFVVGISLVVGGIVIMNIMLVSVVERTKEVGIRKALGARQQDVINQFLVEAVLLCCFGGAVGVTIAYAFSLLIGKLTPLPSSFPLWAPLLAFTLSSIIGIFFGIYPARRAGRLDPIEALRSE